MNKRISQLLLLFLISGNLLSQETFFWTGGTGNWSDINSWSLENGSTPFSIPDQSTDVVFNENSFVQSYDSVFLDLPVTSCHSMIWQNLTTTVNLIAVDSTQELHIYGSLHFDEQVFNKFWGTIRFKSNETGNAIQMNGISLNNAIYFNGTGGEWILQDNLNMSGMAINFDIGDIYLTSGNLVTNGYSIDCSSFLSYNNNSRQLDIQNSTLNLFNGDAFDSWWVNFENLDFQAENSNIVVFADFASFHSANGSDPQYGNLQLKGYYNSIANFEQVSFQKIQVEGHFCQLGNYFSADTVEINGDNCNLGPDAQITTLIINAEQFSPPEGMYINRLISTGHPSLNGSNHYGYADFRNEAHFSSDNTFDTLIIGPPSDNYPITGGHYYFKPGTVQTIYDSLRIRGNQCYNIILQNTQPNTEYAWLKKDFGDYDVQCDFLNINGVAAESATLQFYAGNNSLFYPDPEPLPGWTEGSSSGYFFGFGGMQIEACIGDTVILDASCFNGDQYTEYYWNGDSIPGNITYEVFEPQTVYIYVKYAENCFITDYAIVEFDSCENNIYEVNGNSLFDIYPNPARDNFTLCADHFFMNVQVTIFSIEGKVLIDNAFQSKDALLRKTYDISDLKKGIYLVRLSCNGQSGFQKLIKY